MHNIETIISMLEESQEISFDDSFKYAQVCHALIDEQNPDGYKLAINVLNNWGKLHISSKDLWTNVIEIAGFYPYLQKEHLKLNNTAAEIRKELHGSENIPDKYFHDEQKNLLDLLHSNKNVIVSAPTSFGKSLLIEEIVASRQYRNIIIIQPTLALLDETRKKLLKYNDNYKLIVRTTQKPSEDKGNIFLFTAERVNEYTLFANIDFLVIDEFYKLSGQRDDEKSSSLNNAFYYLLQKFAPKFYLLGPNIDGISAGFAETYNAIFYRSNYSLVDSREINIYQKYLGKFGISGERKEFKENILFELLETLSEEQTIIYCSSPTRVRFLSKKFASYLEAKGKSVSSNTYPLTDWIREFISDDWSLLNTLKYDIGIHDGALQKHITTSIINYFNNGAIKYLFCTSTIIEGVNTSAKNIVYFDAKKGSNQVDYFDYSNIKGRAGRMMVHYIGKIYNFNPPPEKSNIIIDIPFFQQNPIKDEVLIQLDDSDIRDKNTKQYQSILQIPTKEREVIKRNGLSVHGQKQIIDILWDQIYSQYDLIYWNSYPKYEQLRFVLGLAWDKLKTPGESIAPMSKEQLIKITFDYGINKNIFYLVNNQFNYRRKLETNKDKLSTDLRDEAIQFVFQAMKHWFQYKIPKWLSVMNELQRFVCAEKRIRAGNYTYYANLIENDFIRENLAILLEYGVPSSAIRKLESYIPENINQDDILTYIKTNRLNSHKCLIQYEKDKITENI